VGHRIGQSNRWINEAGTTPHEGYGYETATKSPAHGLDVRTLHAPRPPNTALSGEGRGSLAGADFVHSNATLGGSPQANFTG
jgi:hypothetical protein